MKIKSLRIGVLILLAIACTMLFPALARSQEARLKIGVLAKRGAEQCMEMWGTTAEYLTTMVPGFSFEVVPLDFDEIFTVVERGEVDFILSNSSFYVEMEVKYGINRIVTLKNLRAGDVYTVFGGVIFCRADRSDIEHLSDLKGKSFMAVEETSLGGWRMAWRELKTKGIDPQRDLVSLQFGGTHDVVVYAVRDGKIDVGTVRTDTLERMAAEGKIELETFRILAHRKIEDFPFVHSTRLYPEWPFAKVKHTSNELAEKVTVALLQMPADSPAARSGKYAGWTIPANYQPVHECLKDLCVGPYREFGKVTFSDVIKQHWYWFLTVAVFLILVSAATLYMLRLIHRLKRSRLSLEKELNHRKRLEEELTRHREHLERLVNDRTASLRKKNEELQFETTERKRAEEIQLGRNRVLEQLATGASLVEVLSILVKIAEKNNPGMFCSVLLLDKEKKQLLHGAAPSLPDFYNEAINGLKIGPGVGSCGTAAYTGERVIVEDIMLHPYWTKFRELAKKAGVRACWSEPIVSSTDQTLGTFAMYYREPRVPDQSDIEFIKTTAHLAGIAIEKKQTEAALRNAHDELEIKVEERTKELAEANIRLVEASRLKSQFLANMSHELRTPLNSIIGFTGIILQGMSGELNDEQKKQLNMVYGSAKHLLGLINDILDLSKIEAGKIEIHPARFEVKELVQMVGKMVSPMMEEKDLAFEVIVSDNVPPTIYSDRNRIKQVLINLLSNAVKFTGSGKIRLNADFGMRISDLKEGETANGIPSIVFSVSDTGIGIKPEHLSDIFDEFKQIEGPLKEKPTGTGLGLAISKKIVEMMAGRIWAESEYGKGSCLQFAIPVKEITGAERPPAISPEALDLSKKLVLTIDDEVESQEILKTYLKNEGYEVIQAYNAMEAMELARKYHPLAITLDIIMPGKDGWDILHELKKDPGTKDIPVICISILDNREMGLSLGAIEYIVKPIKKDQLMEELQRLKKRFSIYDVLIVDDELPAVELLTRYIGEINNYRVTKAYGGKEGLARVKESRPDLIILDLMMPEVDGFEVIRHLKKSDETKHIPIIIVSAKKLTQEEIEYLNKNIEKIIRKGDFSKEDLLKDIKRSLEGIED